MQKSLLSIKSFLAGIALTLVPLPSPADTLPMSELELCEQVIAMVWHLDDWKGQIDRFDLSSWAYDNVIGHDDLPGPWQTNLASMAILIYSHNPSLRGNSYNDQSYKAILGQCKKKL